MKFLHLGDLHLGKSLGDFDLIDDQRYLLDQVIQICLDRQIGQILIAGDVYDKSIPSEAAVELLDCFLRRLNEQGIRTFIISGNHDSDERLNFGSVLLESQGIHIASKFQGEMKKCVLKDAYGPVNVYLLPFVKASQVRHYFPEDKIENYEDAFRAVIAHTDINKQERNVIVAHQFVVSDRKPGTADSGSISEDPVLSGSEGISVLNVGTVEKIGSSCFEDFDYAALGHIHSGQQIGRSEVRYSGSLMKYSLSEADGVKRIPVIELAEKGRITIETVDLHPVRDLRHIKGKLDRLLDPQYVTGQNDFIYATLTDEEPVDNAMSIFQQVYPNTVKIDYDNAHMRELANMEVQAASDKKPFSEMVSEFYARMYGCPISDEELTILLDVAGEAGVIDETD